MQDFLADDLVLLETVVHQLEELAELLVEEAEEEGRDHFESELGVGVAVDVPESRIQEESYCAS